MLQFAHILPESYVCVEVVCMCVCVAERPTETDQKKHISTLKARVKLKLDG